MRFCCSLFVILCLCTFSKEWHDGFRPYFADDAYYYFVVARHLAASGRSTFDGTSLTIGYQPLWMLLLWLKLKVLSPSLIWVRVVEYVLGLTGLMASFATVDLGSFSARLIFSVGYFSVLTVISFNGMESGLFCCFFLCFILLLARGGTNGTKEGVCQGAFALLTVGARLDSIFFVVPLLLFSAHGVRRKAGSLLVLSLGLAAYVSANVFFFGSLEPVSGQIKSLGGLQWNRMACLLIRDPTSGDATLFYVFVLFLVLSPVVLRSCLNSGERTLAVSFLVGSLLYVSRILFLSSWKIWSWYEYPAMIGFAACVPIVARRFGGWMHLRPSARALSLASGGLVFAAAAFILHSLRDHPDRPEPGFGAVDRKLLQQYGAELNGAAVAMGDRAGEFAYQYAGPVVQTEGLVNDEAFYKLLRGNGDVKQMLCARKVRYLLAYEPDLGTYRGAQIETIRRHLSQFSAPRISVEAGGEVGRTPDAPEFKSEEIDDVDQFLYLWRLDCPR